MERLINLLKGKPGSILAGGEDEPIRAELYSAERLEQFAGTLAGEHIEVAQPKSFPKLLPRLEENGRRLIGVYRALTGAIRDGRSISPAAEWLVDNFHIVEEQLREIRQDLPRSYYSELPKLTRGELSGYPRIYAVAIALTAHTDSRLDVETMRRFVRAYQQVTPLTIGEIWAVAITLRLALVENLRRLAVLIVNAREQREEADALADQLLQLAGQRPAEIVPTLVAYLDNRNRLSRPFVAQIAGRLREQDPSITGGLAWLETQLGRDGESMEHVVQIEHQRQAASQVTVGNIITSMRLLSTLDWRAFFESVSLVDPVLGEDPAGVYALMDFTTRDRYRHVIERISKRTGTHELDVASRAVELARRSINADATPAVHAAEQTEPTSSHVGYYLIDDGLIELEQAFAYRPRLSESLRRAVLRHPTAAYLGLLASLTLLIVGGLLAIGFYYACERAGARLACAAFAHPGERPCLERAQLGHHASILPAPVAAHGER